MAQDFRNVVARSQGTSALQFKDAYIDGTLEADAITIGGTAVTAGGASKGFAIAVAIAL